MGPLTSPGIHEVVDRAHSEIGFSSMERVINCTASVLASRGIQEVSSKYAIEGTAAHTVSEWVREQSVPASTFKGHVVRVVHDGTSTDVKVGLAIVRSVQTFVDAVRAEPGDELIEQRLSVESVVPGSFGTLDAAKLRPGYGSIVEFKHGEGVQKFAEGNPQLLGQALGVILEYDYLYGFEQFKLAISQPRLKHYDAWTCSVGEVLWWADTVLVPAIEQAYGPSPVFKPGSWCQFCKYRHQCPVREAPRSYGRAPLRAEDEFTNLDA